MANYDEAKIGTIRLTPNNDLLPILKKDYEDMNEMFFGEIPVFDEILDTINEIEQEINAS